MDPALPTSIWRRPLTWLLALCLILIPIMGCLALRSHRAALGARARAASAEALERQQVKLAQDASIQAGLDRLTSTKAGELVQQRQAALKARPRPPKAAPMPAEDPALVQGLQEAGLKEGLVLTPGEAPSSLAREDAVKVWDWSQQALRVPALEQRLTAVEQLAEGQSGETAALKTENGHLVEASDAWKAAHAAALERKQALEDEVKAMHRMGTALKVGAAAAVVVVVLRALAGRK